MHDDDSLRRTTDNYRQNSPMQDRRDSRKDYSRAPHRGQASERMDQWNPQDNGYLHQHNGRYRRSRSPRREGRRRYNDRDREDYRSPGYNRSRSHSRSRSVSRPRSPYYGAPPSRTIILEGLLLSITQEDIYNELQHNLGARGLEEVRLIKDRKTGLSRHFAFAQFTDVESARAFLDRYYPTIRLGASSSTPHADGEGAKVRIAFSREKEERDRAGKGDDDWKCEICFLANYSHRVLCFRCNSPRTRPTATGVVGVVTTTAMSSFSGFATTGDSDVSPDNVASQFLLLRGLEPGVSEELLAKGVTKLYKTRGTSPPPDSQAPKKPKIISTSNDASLGAKDGTLQRVLLIRDKKTNDSWRYGFAEFSTVEDAQAAMAKYNASDKFTISSKPVLVSYIHAGVFVPVVQQQSPELDKFTFSPLSNPSLKLMYWDEAGYASELVVARDERSVLTKAKESLNAKLAAAAAKEGLLGESNDAESKVKKRKAEKDAAPSAKKVVAPHLQFWSNRHAELHGLPPKEDDAAENVASSSSKESKADRSKTDSHTTRSFADMNRKCCLLCSRQFKTEAEVTKHESVSQLHRDNLENKDLITKALAKLSKAGIVQSESESSGYRDRAKERRVAFNQPKQPVAQHKANKESVAPKEEDPAPVQSKPVQSKGAALLGKMGWTAGEGLGAKGTGRTEAITTELYTQGVGLGAQGGKIGDAIEEADRATRNSYADFVSKSKDKAKERFERMA